MVETLINWNCFYYLLVGVFKLWEFKFEYDKNVYINK